MRTLTPISSLFPAIAASPFRVAPEAAHELERELGERKIELEFTDKPLVYAEYIPERYTIRLGVSFLSALWASAHAYIIAYHEYQAAQRAGATYFSLGESARVMDAYLLYREARNTVAQRQHFAWPVKAAKPQRYPFEHTDGHMANELFLVAVAWIMHHEIAHARLGHDELTTSQIGEEVAADTSATHWVCDGEHDIQRLHKRAMGIATATMFLLSLDLQVGRLTTTSHPPSYERLINNIDIARLEDDQMLYSFAFVLLDIHLAENGLVDRIDRTGTFRDMCVSACMLLHSLGRDGA
jgi:hypothetical protein